MTTVRRRRQPIGQTVQPDARTSSEMPDTSWLQADEPGAGNDGYKTPEPERGQESGFHAQAPMRAASISFFKVAYKVIGWLIIIAGVFVGILLLSGSVHSQMRMYFGRDAANMIVSIAWIIPLILILSGMMQIAEGNLLGVLQDTNRKLSDQYPTNRQVYTSVTLSVMKLLYIAAGGLEVIAGVLLGIQADFGGFVISTLTGCLSGLFMIMQSKRIALMLDNNSKAAAMAEYLESKNG